MKLFLAGIVALAFLLWLARRQFPALNTFLNSLLTKDTEADTDTNPATGAKTLRSGWFLIGLVFVCVSVSMLETIQPQYFVQDDVRVGEMPGAILGCRALLHGQMPLYNPYVLLGSPLVSTGLDSITYPPTVVAYLIARFLLRNEFLMMDVHAILHILGGYLITYLLARRLKMQALPATLAALSFVLSGCVLIMGRGWHSFIPIIVFTPLLVWAAVVLIEGSATWRWTLGVGAAIALYFQVGFTQIWIYTITLFCLTLITLCLAKQVPLRRCLEAVPALLIGIGLSIPLALQQFSLTRGISRPYGYGEGIRHGLLAMLLPYPFTHAEHPNGWGSAHIEYMGAFFFFGGLFAALLLLNLLILASRRPERKQWADQSWMLLALVVFAFCIGSPGPWSVLIRLPIIKHFNNHPFRLLPFFILFAVLAGGTLLERLLQRLPRRATVEAVLGTVALAILLYHVHLCQPAFYTYTFPAYPALPTAMRDAFLPADSRLQERTLSWATERSADPDYVYTLNHDLPDIYGVLSGSGYNPIIQERGEYGLVTHNLTVNPDAAMQAYGLRWHIIEHSIRPPSPALPFSVQMETTWQYENLFKAVNPERLPVAFTVGDVTVRRLNDVDPIVFPETDRKHPLPFHADCLGAEADVSSLRGGGPVVVNFLWYPEIQAYLDDHPVPSTRDVWGRIRVETPPNTGKLTIRYRPKWRTGIILGLLTVLLGLASFAYTDRASRKAAHRQVDPRRKKLGSERIC